MKDLEILKILDKIFREKYKATKNLEDDGHSISRANAILNYKDGDIRVSLRVSKKAALQQFFDYVKSNGKLKNIDFVAFEEKYNQGIELEKIEEEIRKAQLPGMGGEENSKGKRTKGEK